MEKFLRTYDSFLAREYEEERGAITDGMYPLLYTEVCGDELYDGGNDEVIGEMQISVDAKAIAYVVEVNTFNGKTYRATEVWSSLDAIADDLRYADFSSLFLWGLSQTERSMSK